VTTRRSLAAALFGSLVLVLAVSACGGGAARYSVVPGSTVDKGSGPFPPGNHVLCARIADRKEPGRELEVCAHTPWESADGIDWYCGTRSAPSSEWLGYPSAEAGDPAFLDQDKDCENMIDVAKKSGVLSDV
jgi:hypothetical protein